MVSSSQGRKWGGVLWRESKLTDTRIKNCPAADEEESKQNICKIHSWKKPKGQKCAVILCMCTHICLTHQSTYTAHTEGGSLRKPPCSFITCLFAVLYMYIHFTVYYDSLSRVPVNTNPHPEAAHLANHDDRRECWPQGTHGCFLPNQSALC